MWLIEWINDKEIAEKSIESAFFATEVLRN